MLASLESSLKKAGPYTADITAHRNHHHILWTQEGWYSIRHFTILWAKPRFLWPWQNPQWACHKLTVNGYGWLWLWMVMDFPSITIFSANTGNSWGLLHPWRVQAGLRSQLRDQAEVGNYLQASSLARADSCRTQASSFHHQPGDRQTAPVSSPACYPKIQAVASAPI